MECALHFYLQWVPDVNVRHLIHPISTQSTPYEAHKSTTHLVISNEIASLWHVPDHQQGIMKKRCKVYGVRYKGKGITLTVYGSRDT